MQDSWQIFLDSCVGPCNNLGSTAFVDAWAHTGQLAVFFR